MQKISSMGLIFTIALAISGHTQADVIATHSVISSLETADGYNTTLELTLTNTGASSLADVVLTPSDPMLVSPFLENNNILITSIDSGGIAAVVWTVNTMVPVQHFSMNPINLQGNAVDQYGVLVSFPVVSEGDIQ